MSSKREVFFLILILALASFFRLWQLDSIPPGLYPDEAINLNQALFEPGKVFYPENNGREGLFNNLIALSFRIFGPRIWAARLVPALIGIFTVLGLYLLAKELFPEHRLNTAAALLSSFFLAISFWHVNFSRILFRAILLPLVLVFGFYFLLRGFRNRRANNFIFAGVFFGLGGYTYLAFRVVPLLLVAVLFWGWWISRKKNQQKLFMLNALYLILAAFIVSLPILIYFVQNPADFIFRSAGISVFAQAEPVKSFAQSLVSHLAMFNLRGDFNWRHNISGAPMLFWPIGILFLVGLAGSAKAIICSIQDKNLAQALSYWLLVIWFFLMLLPGILTFEGIPHSLRVIGAIPPTFIFAGLGAMSLYQILRRRFSFQRGSFNYYLIVFSLILLFLSLFLAQYGRYFALWANHPEVESAFAQNYLGIGNYLNSLARGTQKYVIVNQFGVLVKGIPMPGQTIMFIESVRFGAPQAAYLLPEDLDKIHFEAQEAVIVPLEYDEKIMNQLYRMFPGGMFVEIEKGIWAYRVNAQ